MTDVRPERLADRTDYLGTDGDGWALFAPSPGERDLADDHYCERSAERSLQRRARVAARRPGLPPAAAARFSAALIAVGVVGVQATDIAAAAPVTTSSGTLQEGDSGSAVRALQRALGIGADGAFGRQTKKAVRAFQRAHGLEVDGVVGPATRSALGLGSSSSRTGSAARRATAGKSEAGGSTSTDAAFATVPAATARAVQEQLGVPADGEWGPASARALEAWQSEHGLEADGVPGPATLRAMGISAAAATSAPASASASTGSSSSAVEAARSKIGAPYASGGNGPSSFDCSGLTVYAFRAAGVSLPRTSYAQYGMGSAVSKGSVQAGDLVFFSTAGAGASHVGVATSSSTVISATSHGVMEHSFTSGYWADYYVGARRV